MQLIETTGQALAAIERAKTNTTAFCTNFFPSVPKLQGWIDHAEFFGELHDEAAFFLRKDRDFWHLYFCAANSETLNREIKMLTHIRKEPVVIDLVGHESALNELAAPLEAGGFRPYCRLQRMARLGQSLDPKPADDSKTSVGYADLSDVRPVFDMICGAFDRYAEQLPMLYEVKAAIENRQVFVAKHEGMLAGLLFFETQGLTSMLRYWLVGGKFRTFHLGSALMNHYLVSQNNVRRFLLWVLSGNESAIQKYRHYGYAADGLVDLVLANRTIRA